MGSLRIDPDAAAPWARPRRSFRTSTEPQRARGPNPAQPTVSNLKAEYKIGPLEEVPTLIVEADSDPICTDK